MWTEKSNQMKYQPEKEKILTLKRVFLNLCKSSMNLIVTRKMTGSLLHFRVRKEESFKSLRKFIPTKSITFSCVHEILFE